MLEYLKEEANKVCTENGAVTNGSTYSDCLDLFGIIGALRSADVERIQYLFTKAYAEDADLAMKMLFYARDIRGGLGERRVFQEILRWLAVYEPESLRKNLYRIPEFGRFDDLLCLFETPCESEMAELVREQLDEDKKALESGTGISLLAKWLPSVNASSAKAKEDAKRMAALLGMTAREYRKLLSALRQRLDLMENHLREMEYSFDYEKQPSKAMFRYRKAFLRNDRERYKEFLADVAAGKKALKTGCLMPYDIVSPLIHHGGNLSWMERQSADITWDHLEDFTNGENAIAVVDVSASMFWYGSPKPADVAVSLGIYFAERSRGDFRDHFITFSSRPKLVKIKGNDIAEKVRCCLDPKHVGYSTDIQAVFDLILKTAVKNRLKQEELPSRIYIISDMEFDACTENGNITNFELAKNKYEKNGYCLPQLVFWNVQSRQNQQPVTKNEQGAVLVSGCTPRIFSQIMPGGATPYEQMMEILSSERYAEIAA